MDCPCLYPLQLLTRKWSYLILRALRSSRHSADLQRELRFITNRMLARELTLLKNNGLLIATSDHGHTRYELTAAGHALLRALEPLVQWSVRYAGTPPCAPEQQCSHCMYYPAAVRPR